MLRQMRDLLEAILTDSARYPQLRLPAMQERRVKSLLAILKKLQGED